MMHELRQGVIQRYWATRSDGQRAYYIVLFKHDYLATVGFSSIESMKLWEAENYKQMEGVKND